MDGGDKEPFLAKFGKVASPGFHPDRDIVRVGCANQTTMLSSESMQIAKMIRKACVARYGAEKINRAETVDSLKLVPSYSHQPNVREFSSRAGS